MKRLLCLLGVHNWEMSKYTIRSGKRFRKIHKEGFDRECLWCGKEQRLERPKYYHPTKYVWTNQKKGK